MLDSRANCSQPQLWKTGTVTCLEAVPRAADGFISSIAQSVFSCNQSLWPRRLEMNLLLLVEVHQLNDYLRK